VGNWVDSGAAGWPEEDCRGRGGAQGDQPDRRGWATRHVGRASLTPASHTTNVYQGMLVLKKETRSCQGRLGRNSLSPLLPPQHQGSDGHFYGGMPGG